MGNLTLTGNCPDRQTEENKDRQSSRRIALEFRLVIEPYNSHPQTNRLVRHNKFYLLEYECHVLMRTKILVKDDNVIYLW